MVRLLWTPRELYWLQFLKEVQSLLLLAPCSSICELKEKVRFTKLGSANNVTT